MSRNPRSSERGAAIIEAAFVTFPFILILFAIFEFGLLSRNNLTTTNASSEGARAASVFGREASADFYILQTIKQGIAPMGASNIDYIVVYRVQNIGDPMNTTCHTVSVALPASGIPPAAPEQQPCNRYTAADLDLALLDTSLNPTGNFGCLPTSVDSAWCPTFRNTSLSGPPDLVGVYVKTTHTYVSRMFGNTKELDQETVIQLEPDRP